ncbi:DUF1657 domain-containing protein [Garciella nitratireducens]|uniref:DUF1657 domain-containing protein n=1 Tax=Garciella nitratireducens DSM 15102 TaxID=1121911 RepID=A0A1T4LGX7_9FIRM|nr:DUF1657 domain-containing protein [Garciella nitratireducens]RBP46802.1 uncharacterized protein DUF1657 [Garciella nitratireducens]SJZ53955.1 Protein of unknown function [Garciella nitratireducens DSM 15102]
MSTINKLEQALAGAQSLASQMKTFSMDTDNQDAKQMFQQLATNAENMSQMLQSRINFVKEEEPQYNNQQ